MKHQNHTFLFLLTINLLGLMLSFMPLNDLIKPNQVWAQSTQGDWSVELVTGYGIDHHPFDVNPFGPLLGVRVANQKTLFYRTAFLYYTLGHKVADAPAPKFTSENSSLLTIDKNIARANFILAGGDLGLNIPIGKLEIRMFFTLGLTLVQGDSTYPKAIEIANQADLENGDFGFFLGGGLGAAYEITHYLKAGIEYTPRFALFIKNLSVAGLPSSEACAFIGYLF